MTETPFAITLKVGTSLINETGSWRTNRPVYLDRLPPCNNACPAGENIQAWLFKAEEGDYKGAWQEIMRNNPMPSVMGRACYHPCENACNRGEVDEAVGIHAVERFLGDLANQEGWTVEVPAKKSGKKVLVIGAGPGGLSAAYHLTVMGHEVTVVDGAAKAGGMLRYGIPAYRLPREALDADIQRIADMGVTFKMGARVDDIAKAKADGGFDAVFLSIGAQAARKIDIENDGSVPVSLAIDVLRDVEENPDGLKLGDDVVVLGGGNVAMDVARSAIRLGAKNVKVVVLEDWDQMPAHKFEVKETLEEGAEIQCLRSIKAAGNGMVTLEEMYIDDTGKSRPTANFSSINASSLVLAIGQAVDVDVVGKVSGIDLVDGVVKIDGSMKTGVEGIFAGGDMVPSARTMTTAIGHGKKAARNIDAWLRGETYAPAKNTEIAEFSMMNDWYYGDAPREQQPQLELVRRQSGFEEVLLGLEPENALFEARRCLSCGNCFECDTCYGVCPDNAVLKLGPGKRFEFKYDYCKGCGLCAAECPCGAIKMVAEQI